MSDDQRFHCKTYDCKLGVATCLQRQGTRLQVRVGLRRPSLPDHLWFCGSGRCEQGKALAKEHGGVQRKVVATTATPLGRR